MPKLSILIPSLECRAKLLNRLLYSLSSCKETEILVSVDNGEETIGSKINKLVDNATGEYICFIGDDDGYSDNFIDIVVDNLKENHPDIITFDIKCYYNGAYTKPTIHSIRFNEWVENNEHYIRHLGQQNIIKSSIVKQFRFIDSSLGEDRIWANELYNSGQLKTELYIKDIHYNYNFDISKSMSGGRKNSNNQDIDWEIKDLSEFKFIKFLEK